MDYEDERNEVELNEEEGMERKADNWEKGKTFPEKSGKGTSSGAISVIALAIAIISIIIAICAVSGACGANLVIAELQEQVSKLEQAPANVNEPSSENEDATSEPQKSATEVKEASSENTEEISKLKQSLTAEGEEVSSEVQQDDSKLQKEIDEVAEAISDIQSDVSKANDWIGEAESRITELEKKPQSTNGNGGSSSQDTSKKDDEKEEDSENKYSKGLDCVYFFDAREMVKDAYNAGQITHEQLKRYVDSYLTIYNKAIKDEEISAEDVNRHNSILKGMPGVNYNWYHIKSDGSEYLRGLKDKIRYYAYCTAMEYYYKAGKIPKDEYDKYDKKVDKTISSASEKDTRDTVDIAREIINERIGNPDEVIKSNDWRGVTDVDTFLDYID